jgi:hypothetical protein
MGTACLQSPVFNLHGNGMHIEFKSGNRSGRLNDSGDGFAEYVGALYFAFGGEGRFEAVSKGNKVASSKKLIRYSVKKKPHFETENAAFVV